MSIRTSFILLLKAQTETANDKYEELLNANGFDVANVKTLNFNFKNINDLAELLKCSELFCGIILSSPRCVDAVYQALNFEKMNDKWHLRCNYSVGEKTHNDAMEKLGLITTGKESGNAQNLSKLIMEDKNMYEGKPFLFPHGNLKTDTLKIELGKEGINIKEVLVYDTVPNPTIESDLISKTENFNKIPEYIVFFSPSGVHSTLKYLRKFPVELNSLKIIAIGPVTELALKEENLDVYGVAKNPTPHDVLSVIEKPS